MNIALFASAFYPSLGGVEELCRQLAHAYKRKGHEVIVLTEQWPRSSPAFEQYEGIPVHRFPMRVPINSWKSKLTYALTHRAIRARIARLLREFRADVLHVQCVSTSAWYAMHAGRELKLPLAVTLQGELNMDANQVFQRSAIHQRIMHESLRDATAITACSRQTLEEAEEFFGQPFGERGRVIYNGIALQEFAGVEAHSHSRPYIFAIGRHVREKGFDVLLRAFEQAGDLNCDLLIAGAGTETENLKRIAAERPALRERVLFLGRLGHDTAIRYFKGSLFFVLPSRHEPFGMVNLEAMAAGKAVVASRVGGVPEIVLDEVTGLLTPPEDVDALSQALRRLAFDDATREKFGAAGEACARRFDWPDLAEQYQEVYRAVQPADRKLQELSSEFRSS